VKAFVELLRGDRSAQLFFLAFTQSALGTGAAYVGLLIVAYERFRSPWAISIILIADLLPPMLLGPMFGALADRWSRRLCCVVADIARALAFVGIATVASFEATVAFALLAGAGNALFKPASLAALPSLVARPKLPAATALYGAIDDFGFAVGPALAAVLLLISDTETVFLFNGATFALSALLLFAIDFGQVKPRPATANRVPAFGVIGEMREGLRAMRHVSGLWTVLGGSALALFFVGLVNVAEVPFITGDLGASDAAYSAAVALYGVGVAAGSMAGSSGGALQSLRRKFLFGLFVMGFGNLTIGLANSVAVVFGTFALAGVGNGMMLVYERLIIQATVPDRLYGRVFGVNDAMTAWAFALSFLAAGAVVSLAGARPAIVASGIGVIAAAGLTAVLIRSIGLPLGRRARVEPGPDRGLGKHRANLVDGRDHWIALVDDLD
jgi:MFS family permease